MDGWNISFLLGWRSQFSLAMSDYWREADEIWRSYGCNLWAFRIARCLRVSCLFLTKWCVWPYIDFILNKILVRRYLEDYIQEILWMIFWTATCWIFQGVWTSDFLFTHTSPKPENQKIETFSAHSTPTPYTPLPTGVSTPLAYLYLGNKIRTSWNVLEDLQGCFGRFDSECKCFVVQKHFNGNSSPGDVIIFSAEKFSLGKFPMVIFWFAKLRLRHRRKRPVEVSCRYLDVH